VLITSDLGEYALPKWASWVKVVIDGALFHSTQEIYADLYSCHLADDLPLNVSRETLQSSSFLKQIKQIIIRRLIQLFSKIAEDDQEKYEEITKVYGTVLKLGASEDGKNRDKLAALVRLNTNQRNGASFDSVSGYVDLERGSDVVPFSIWRTGNRDKSR
jgi:heat shock protein beta